MKHLNKALLILFIALTGCASTLPIPKATIDASLLQPCQALVPLQGITGKDVIQNITQNASIYHDCADSKQALINAVK